MECNRSTIILSIFTIFLLCMGHVSAGRSIQRELTISVDAGTIECLYETIQNGQVIDIEYQVIDGGHGDLDISFELHNPEGRRMASDYKRTDNMHRLITDRDGDHRICFDNSFSSFNRKTVFFEMIIESVSQDSRDADDFGIPKDIFDGLPEEQLVLEMKMQDITDIVTHMHGNLNKIKHDLDIRRSVEARDRNVAEENNFRVTTWSMFQIGFMLIVGGIQVYMVRSLFDTDSRSSTIWRKLKMFK